MTPAQLVSDFCKKHFLLVCATVLLGLLEAVCTSVGTALIVPAAFGFLGFVNPNKIFAEGALSGVMPENIISLLPGLVVTLLLSKIVLASLASALKTELMRRLDMQLRVGMLDKFLSADLSLVRTISPGDVLHRLGYSVNSSVASFGLALESVRLTLGVITLCAILLYCSWPLTMLSGLLVVVLIVTLYLTSKRSHQLGRYKTKVARNVGIYAKDLVDGIRTVKERGSESFELRRLMRLFRVSEKVNFLSHTHILITESICEFAALAILFTALVVMRSTVLLVYLPVLLRLLTMLNRLGNACISLTNSYPEFYLVCDFLNQTDKRILTSGNRRLESLEKDIQIKDLTFTFGTSKTPLFNDLSLRIEKGTTIAIVGVSGVGKTTLCDLLLRFFDPDSGQILLDGVDLKEFDLNSIRQKVAIISQDNFLFARSVKSNIILGAHGVSSARFDEAIQTAGLEEVVKRLPQGVNSVLGAGGSSLSLGERQRIAIARAIIIQPEILILDEATGAVDPVLDKQIHSALTKIGPNCTRIVISHRPSTIRQAQVIALLSSGKVVEIGSHEELMRKRGEYAQLYGDN